RDSQIRDFHRAAGAREDIIGQLHAEIGRQSSALQKSNRTVQSLMERITRFHEQIAHQVAMIEALNAEIHALKNSTSWRITAPIRGIKKPLQPAWRAAVKRALKNLPAAIKSTHQRVG